MKLTKLFLIVFISLIFITSSYASEIIDTGISARSKAMAGAFTPLNEDTANAVFGNPAVLNTIPTAEIVNMYSNLSGDITYSILGIAFPSNYGDFSLGYAVGRSDDIPVTSLDANSRIIQTSSYNYFDNMLIAGVAKRFNEQLSYGIKLKYIQKGSDGVQGGVGTGLNADLGLFYKVNDEVNLGLQAVNILTGNLGALQWGNGTVEDLPSGINSGFEITKGKLKIVIDYLYRRVEASKMKLGAEYQLWENFDLRAGIAQTSLPGETYNNYTLGIGYTMKNLKIDYAYDHNALLSYDSRHFISLSFLLPQYSRPKTVIKTCEAKTTEKEKIIEFKTPIVEEIILEEKPIEQIKPIPVISQKTTLKKTQKPSQFKKILSRKIWPKPKPQAIVVEQEEAKEEVADVKKEKVEIKLGRKVLIIISSVIAGAAALLLMALFRKK